VPLAQRSQVRKAADSTRPERAVARVINQSTQLLTYQALTDEALAAAAAGPQALIDHLQWEPVIQKLGDVVPILEDAVGKAALAEAGKIEAQLSLNTVDALSEKYANEEAGKLIKNITDTQRTTIREVLGRAQGGQLTKDAAARQIRQSIGLHPAWAQAVRNFEAKQLRTVPKGYSPARWAATVEKRTDAYYNRLLRRRADTIARTEIITAENLGRYATWADSIGRGLNGVDSLKEWSPGPGACRVCQKRVGEKVLWNQPFSGGIMMPPAHPNCRCTAVLLPAPYQNPALRPRTIDWLSPTGDRYMLDFDPWSGGFDLLDNIPTSIKPAAPVADDLVRAAAKDLTRPEADEVLEYAEAGYWDMNKALRAGTPDEAMAGRVKTIDDAIAKQAPLGDNITVYRGLHVALDEDRDWVGRVMNDRSFTSTTLNRETADFFNNGWTRQGGYAPIRMEIEVPKGTRGLSVQNLKTPGTTRVERAIDGESEFILPRNLSYRITEEYMDGDTRVLKAVVDDGDPKPAVSGGRVKPTEADNLTYESTLHWSDDKLMQMMTRYADDDPEAMDKILDIIDQRAAAEEARQAAEARLIAGYQQQQKLDAEAKRYRDENPATNPTVKPERNLNARQVNEEEYRQYVGSQINRALDDLNGVFFNNKMLQTARSKGITEESLFTGPYHVAQKYASDELKEWWLQNGRETLGSFRYRVFQRPTDKVHADRVKNLGHASGQARSTREYGL
jgi:ADP-ribosyltransferase exoenzyme/Phage Mu protein F like protein